MSKDSSFHCINMQSLQGLKNDSTWIHNDKFYYSPYISLRKIESKLGDTLYKIDKFSNM